MKYIKSYNENIENKIPSLDEMKDYMLILEDQYTTPIICIITSYGDIVNINDIQDKKYDIIGYRFIYYEEENESIHNDLAYNLRDISFNINLDYNMDIIYFIRKNTTGNSGIVISIIKKGEGYKLETNPNLKPNIYNKNTNEFNPYKFNESVNTNYIPTLDELKDYMQVLEDEYLTPNILIRLDIGMIMLNIFLNTPRYNRQKIKGYRFVYNLKNKSIIEFIQLLKGVCLNINMDYKNIDILFFIKNQGIYVDIVSKEYNNYGTQDKINRYLYDLPKDNFFGYKTKRQYGDPLDNLM